MRGKVARAAAADTDDSQDDEARYKTQKRDTYADSDDDDDLPSFAAVASTSASAGKRTSLRKASAPTSTSTSTSSAPAPAPKPAPARRARPRPTASKAAAAASQSAPKRVLTAAEQEELRKIREKEQEEDDFFTSKREFTFKTGGKQTALPLPKGRVAPSSSSKQPVKSKPTQKVVINLDQDDFSSSSESHSGSDSDSSETRAKRKRRKKSKTPVKLASPTKRAASSSSSSSSDSDSDSSAQRRKKRLKAEKKGISKTDGQNGRDRKGKGRSSDGVKDEPKNKERSLSPLAQADTFEVAHALQDIRRHRPSMGRRYHVSSEGEDPGQEATDELGELVGADGVPGQSTSRSRSASQHRGDSMDPLGHGAHARTSMTPFVDDHELTEEEKEAKYGPMTSISVRTVNDPRIVITDQNRNGVKRYTAPMDIKVRSRENFENVFGRVSTEKGIERNNIVITYNGQRLYSFGTPQSLSILSSANFEAYPREVFDYVQLQRREQRDREVAQAKEHQLESIARGNMPGAQRNRAIILDEGENDGLAATKEDENDSDIEMVPPAGGRLASLQPAEATNGRDERSASLAAAETGNTGAAASREPALKVTIRGGPQQQLNLRVPLTKTISILIKAYLKKFGFDMALSSKCKVFFDGEALSHDLKLEDAEIEDEDTLDIRVPSS